MSNRPSGQDISSHQALQEHRDVETDARQVYLRQMQPSDLDQVKALHEECFPVHYKQRFFTNVVRGWIQREDDGPHEPVFTQVAVAGVMPNSWVAVPEQEMLVGLVTAQLQDLDRCGDDEHIRFAQSREHYRVMYILTLGTSGTYRRGGVGRALLQWCVSTAAAQTGCGAVYLHVITHNHTAMRFYEAAGFRKVCTLADYYTIQGQKYPCYLYLLNINGSSEPWHPSPSAIAGTVARGFQQLLHVLRRWLSVRNGRESPPNVAPPAYEYA